MSQNHSLFFTRCLRFSLVSWIGLSPLFSNAAESPGISPVSSSAAAPLIRLEAEDGQRAGGLTVTSAVPGFSGAGYVANFLEDKDRLTLTFQARAGVHDVSVRYRAPVKGFRYEVNGLLLTAKFVDSRGEFAEQRIGKVELRDGQNTFAIYGGWKGYEIDRVELSPLAALPALVKPPATLCDPDAIPAARELMAYLVENYGEGMLSGAIEGPDVSYVEKHTGKLPAIIASDLLNVSTASIRYSGVVPGETEQIIERAKQGHIVTFCWHWRSPSGLLDRQEVTTPSGKVEDARWYKGFYTYATTFDVEAALADPAGKDYLLLMTDIDMIAGELRKLADWGIPVLWRPLHESEGRWFWWGAKGPQPFIQLWRIMYDRLTRVHGLHNLIWVYTGTANREWYPGDDVVDIIGIDDYPASVNDPLSAIWDDVQRSFSGQKLVALSEFGGVPDIALGRRLGVRWSYFASWNADLGPMKMTHEALKSIYRDPRMINLSELPKNRWKPFAKKIEH